MIERNTNQAGTANGNNAESALWHLDRYIELSGLREQLRVGHRNIAGRKIHKDLGKIETAGDNIWGSETHNALAHKTILESGGFKLFWEENLVEKPNGKKVELSPTETNVLHLLMSKPGRVTRFYEFRKIWPGTDTIILVRRISLYICYLRDKLDDVCLSKPTKRREDWEYIKTIYGRGYMWVGDVRDDSDHLLDAGF